MAITASTVAGTTATTIKNDLHEFSLALLPVPVTAAVNERMAGTGYALIFSSDTAWV